MPPIEESRLSIATSRLFFIAAAVFAICAIIIGNTPSMDRTGAMLVCGFSLMLAIALRTVSLDLKAHVLAISWFAFIFFLPRLFTFAAFPPETITAIGLDHLTPEEVTRGLAFIIAGTLALFFGLWVGNLPFSKEPISRNKYQNSHSLPLGPILLFWIAAVAATYYVAVILQVTIFGDPENWGSRSGWLMRIFDTDVALLLLLVWTAVHLARKKPNYWLLFGLLTTWVIISVYMGSRGGPLRIFIVIGLAAIALRVDPEVTLRKLFLILALTFSANAVLYPISTAIRYGLGEVENPTSQLVVDWQRNTSPPPFDPQAFSSAQHALWTNEFYIGFARAVAPITTRLGVVDYPLIIVNRPPDHDVINSYLSIGHSLRNYANNMVPGELFPDYDVMSSRVFTMAYRGYPESHIRQIFLSEPWTSWGYAWVKGGPIGGLFILATLTAISQIGYRFLGNIFPPSVAPYALTTWLFVVTLNGPVQLFGIDHWLTVASHVFMSLTTSMFFVWATSKALSRMGISSSFWVLNHHRPRYSTANSESIESHDGTS